MPDLQPVFDPAGNALDEVSIAELRSALKGPVLRQPDEGYDAARALWNGMIDKRPGLIAQCTGVADVITAVRFARQHDLLVAVKGGGHNVAGSALCDGGLVIDLSGMRGVHVDPVGRTARVQPGARLGDVDHETQAFGLAVPAGIVTTTGVAGLTLGGGFGWLSPKLGLTCDNLISADVVTADGELVTASEEENADLFWGIRGGGGNFGVVTSFHFSLHPVGPTVLAGAVIHPMANAEALLKFHRDFVADSPRELCTIFVLRWAPRVPFLPSELHGKPIAAFFVCYQGQIDEGERVLKDLRRFGDPLADVVAPKPFSAYQSMLDAVQPPGRNYYWKSEDLPDLSDGSIDAIVEHSNAITSPHTIVPIFQLGGAVADVDATAYSHRKAAYALNCNASWEDGDPTPHVELGQGLLGGAGASLDGRLRQLPGRRGGGPGQERIWCGEIRQAGGAEGPLRPDKLLPRQPEHQAVAIASAGDRMEAWGTATHSVFD